MEFALFIVGLLVIFAVSRYFWARSILDIKAACSLASIEGRAIPTTQKDWDDFMSDYYARVAQSLAHGAG